MSITLIIIIFADIYEEKTQQLRYFSWSESRSYEPEVTGSSPVRSIFTSHSTAEVSQ